jgi:hypothetical protein
MRWPSWADLRTIGNSGAVRAAIVVPVIGYLIILNSSVADFLKLHGIEPVNHPLSWWDRLWGTKLYLIYFGLMFLGLGSAVYQWKCPHFVKKYPDWTDYVAGTAPHTDSSQHEVLAGIVGANYYMDNFTGTADDRLQRYLHAHYSLMSNDVPAWRVVTFIFFGLGFFLLSIPSAMTAIRVAIALIHNE